MGTIDETVFWVEEWSKARGLDKTDPRQQLLKLQEELGELAQGELKAKPDQIADSIGDMMVVLTIYCQQKGIELTNCFGDAYDVIKDRKGKLVDGVFIKEEDLHD